MFPTFQLADLIMVYLLGVVTGQAAAALENARLYEAVRQAYEEDFSGRADAPPYDSVAAVAYASAATINAEPSGVQSPAYRAKKP